jgi:hypothetical protein
MNGDNVFWLVLPLLAVVILLLVAKRFPQPNQKTRNWGLVIAVIIVLIGIIWRLTQGGF